MMWYKKTVAVILLTFNCTLAFALPNNFYQQGVQFFKNGQYKEAIKSFHMEEKQGKKSPALYHNLAISYFKIKNYNMASRYYDFERRYPAAKMSGIYGRGLVALAQDNNTLALKYFKYIINNSTSPRFKSLAQYRIQQLRKKPKKRSNVFIQLNYGNDDNIKALPSDAPTKEADSYYTYFINGRYQLTGTKEDGVQVNANIYNFDYDRFNEYDIQVLGLSLKKNFPISNWKGAFSITGQRVSLGGNDYQGILKYETRFQHNISDNNRVGIRLRHDDIRSQNGLYNYLEGTRQRLRLSYRYDVKNTA